MDVGLSWFRTGKFYARGDVAPFIRSGLHAELGSLWSHQDTGAGGPTYEIVRSFEVLFIDIARLIGGTEALGQRLFFAALFAFTASGVAAAAARLTRRAGIVFVAGVIGAFNPLIMVNLPNFLIALLIALMGWTAALTMDAAGGTRSARPRLFALLTLGVAYLSLNPPLLVILIVWLAMLPLFAAALSGAGRVGFVRSLRFLAVAAAWAIPLALWWVIPYIYAIRTAALTGTIAANTDVFAWSWTQVHNSLDRVLPLVAKWSWPDEKFGWTASGFARPAWIWTAYVLPMGALAAPLVCRPKRRRAALWMVTVMLGCAFVAKGLNSPFRGVNAFLYLHVPGMFLLREPMSKVGGLIALCSVAAWILALDGLLARRRVLQWKRSPLAAWAAVGAIAMLVAPLTFALPMLTGSVVQSRERMALPPAWRQVARIVDDGLLPGKALVLPLDDFYQVPTTWGYYGSDVVPAQVITRPTIVRRPQAYIGDPSGYEQLSGAVEAGLVGRDPSKAAGAMRALGVSYIVVRKDIDYESPIRKVEMPRPLAISAGLAHTPSARRIASTSIADVYEFSDSDAPVAAFTGTIAARNARAGALADLVSTAPTGTAIVTSDPKGTPLVRDASWSLDVNRPTTITPPSAGDWTSQRTADGTPIVELRSNDRGLVLHDPVTVRIGHTAIASAPDVPVASAARAVAASVDGSLFDLTNADAYARVETGAVVTAYSRGTGAGLGSWSGVKDCNNYDSVPPGSVFSDFVTTPDGRNAIRLRAAKHSACVSAPLVDPKPGDVLRVVLEQRGIRGAAPRTCLWQSVLKQCARLNWSARERGDWFALSAVFRVPRNAGRVALYVYADAPAAGSAPFSETWYRGVKVDPLVPGPVTTVDARALPRATVHLPAGPIRVATSFDAPKPFVGPRADASDCGRRSARTLRALGIRAWTFRANDPTAVSISADHDSGCVSMPVYGLRPGIGYELSVDHKVFRGGAPRICMWEEPARRCAALQVVSESERDAGRLVVRGRTASDVVTSRLFLYADAARGGTTIAYSRIRLRLIADESLILRPATITTGSLPEITWHRAGAARYQVQVHDAQRPFVLALTDAYSRDWHVHGLPPGVNAIPIEIDGYRNGWSIDARGDMNLNIEYGPARLGHAAVRLSQLALLALFASVAVPGVRRFRRRRVDERRRRSHRTGPRRVQIPDAWLLPADRGVSDPRGRRPVITL